MNLRYTDEASDKIRKACARNKELGRALEKKVAFILENPEHCKPLRNEFAGRRRVHILRNYVLVYSLHGDTVLILDFDHHDNVYL